MKDGILPRWLRRKGEDPALPVRTDYLAVSSLHGKLLALLREHMVPEVMAGPEEIGLCSPREHGDITLGIYLYDIRENGEIRLNGMQFNDETSLTYPPLHLDLYYMITAYSGAELRYREEENHRILAKAMQVLHDYPRLHSEQPLHIELIDLTLEQKAAVWNHYSTGYQLSLFYKVSPVRLDSLIRQETTRVQEIHISAGPRRQ